MPGSTYRSKIQSAPNTQHTTLLVNVHDARERIGDRELVVGIHRWGRGLMLLRRQSFTIVSMLLACAVLSGCQIHHVRQDESSLELFQVPRGNVIPPFLYVDGGLDKDCLGLAPGASVSFDRGPALLKTSEFSSLNNRLSTDVRGDVAQYIKDLGIEASVSADVLSKTLIEVNASDVYIRGIGWRVFELAADPACFDRFQGGERGGRKLGLTAVGASTVSIKATNLASSAFSASIRGKLLEKFGAGVALTREASDSASYEADGTNLAYGFYSTPYELTYFTDKKLTAVLGRRVPLHQDLLGIDLPFPLMDWVSTLMIEESGTGYSYLVHLYALSGEVIGEARLGEQKTLKIGNHQKLTVGIEATRSIKPEALGGSTEAVELSISGFHFKATGR